MGHRTMQAHQHVRYVLYQIFQCNLFIIHYAIIIVIMTQHLFTFNGINRFYAWDSADQPASQSVGEVSQLAQSI